MAEKDVLIKNASNEYESRALTGADITGGGGGGAPTDADYLVGTANAGLSAEIVVGATPGGELGGTWASPTVDATHAGSAHVALGTTPSTQAFGDTAAGGAATTASKNDHKHAMPGDPVTAHVAAGDPHTGYRLESADHTHATTGLQGGTIAHSVLTGITGTDHHVAPASGPDAAITVDAAGAAGTASTFARSGHGHRVDTDSGVASTQAFGDSATAGTSGSIQRGGHKHAMPADPVTAHVAAGDPHPTYLTSAEGNAAYQPLDSDLTAVAALATQSFGRGFLTLIDSAAWLTQRADPAVSAGVNLPTTTYVTGTAVTMVGRVIVPNTNRLALEGTARLTVTDASIAEMVVGTPRTAQQAWIVPNDADWGIAQRLALEGSVRGTVRGTGRVIVTDDFGTRSRIVLAGRG